MNSWTGSSGCEKKSPLISARELLKSRFSSASNTVIFEQVRSRVKRLMPRNRDDNGGNRMIHAAQLREIYFTAYVITSKRHRKLVDQNKNATIS